MGKTGEKETVGVGVVVEAKDARGDELAGEATI